jgi:hypothetical protein
VGQADQGAENHSGGLTLVQSGTRLLAKFSWPDHDPVTALRSELKGNGCDVFRAIEAEEGCAYVALPAHQQQQSLLVSATRRALPNATLSRLVLLMDLPGASAGEAAPYHYVVETDVMADQEADFNAWYDREHLHGLASVGGTVRAMRFRSIDGQPRYHACYDLIRPETLGSPPWLAVRGTPWSDRVRPAFFNTTRTMFRRV